MKIVSILFVYQFGHFNSLTKDGVIHHHKWGRCLNQVAIWGTKSDM